MNNQTDFTEKERRKIIFISAGLIILILILIVASIIVTVKRANNTEITTSNNEEVVFVDSNLEKEIEQETGQKETEVKSSNEEKKSSITPTTSIAPNVVETSNLLADTGPEDLLPLALLCGSLTTFLTSLFLTKKA